MTNLTPTCSADLVSAPLILSYLETFEPLLSPIAIIVSALGAWHFAASSIRNSAKTSRQKSTFDYLSKLSWDRDYIEAKSIFISVKLGSKKIRAVAEEYERMKSNGHHRDHEHGIGQESDNNIIREHSAIKNILNEYEALAIAIKSGALDKEMVRQNIQQQFVDHVDACREFIEYTRTQAAVKKPKAIWCELQALAEEWRLPES